MSSTTQPTPMIQTHPNDAYAIGWRDVPTRQADGSEVILRIPLTLEDALHPELGDVMPENKLHECIRRYLADVFSAQLRHDPSARVFSDQIIVWDQPGLKQNSPDVSVVVGLEDFEDLTCSVFDAGDEGVRPCLIIEIVSPRTRENGIEKKLKLYHQAQVETYVILDHEKLDEPWVLYGYQYTPTHYEAMPLDDQGRLWLEAVRVWLGVHDYEVICYDSTTGKKFLKYSEEIERSQQEKARADAAELRAGNAEKRAAQEKARADALEEKVRRLLGGEKP